MGPFSQGDFPGLGHGAQVIAQNILLSHKTMAAILFQRALPALLTGAVVGVATFPVTDAAETLPLRRNDVFHLSADIRSQLEATSSLISVNHGPRSNWNPFPVSYTVTERPNYTTNFSTLRVERQARWISRLWSPSPYEILSEKGVGAVKHL